MCKAHTYVIAFNCHTNTFIYRQERQALEEKALAQGPTKMPCGTEAPDPSCQSSVQLCPARSSWAAASCMCVGGSPPSPAKREALMVPA